MITLQQLQQMPILAQTSLEDLSVWSWVEMLKHCPSFHEGIDTDLHANIQSASERRYKESPPSDRQSMVFPFVHLFLPSWQEDLSVLLPLQEKQELL